MSFLGLHPVVLIVIAITLLANLLASRAVLFDDGVTNSQKALQLVLVWLVPLIGAGVVISLVGSHHSREELRGVLPFPLYLLGYEEGATYKANPNHDVDENSYGHWRD